MKDRPSTNVNNTVAFKTVELFVVLSTCCRLARQQNKQELPFIILLSTIRISVEGDRGLGTATCRESVKMKKALYATEGHFVNLVEVRFVFPCVTNASNRAIEHAMACGRYRSDITLCCLRAFHVLADCAVTNMPLSTVGIPRRSSTGDLSKTFPTNPSSTSPAPEA